jgi:hypothetical protein
MRLLPVPARNLRLCKSLSLRSAAVYSFKAPEGLRMTMCRRLMGRLPAAFSLFFILWRIVAKLDLFTRLQIWQQSRETSVLAISRTEGLIA